MARSGEEMEGRDAVGNGDRCVVTAGTHKGKTGTVEDRRKCGIGPLRCQAKDKQQRRTEDREWYARHQ